jgi:hypothetical protein
MNLTFRGITIDSSDNLQNASDSIRVKREFDSNVIDESNLQDEKHFDPRISTLRGIVIDLSDDDENANDSIRVNCEFDSNTIELSASGAFKIPTWTVGRCKFRKRIEFGIQRRTISGLLSPQSGTGLIEPSFTTIRRS